MKTSKSTNPGLHIAASACLVLTTQAIDIVDSTPANNQANTSSQAGQTFTTPALGINNQLFTITIRGPQTGPSATLFTLKVWEDVDQDFATWDPGTLIATSTNDLAINTANGNHIFTFNGELLSDSTVYAFSFNDGITDHVGFRTGLTNAPGDALTDGALFSAGAQPFGAAFDVSFIVNTNAGPKDVVWTGATDGIWDTTTTNWQLPNTTPALFGSGDSVSFDDTGANSTITIVGALDPFAVNVTNDAVPYTFGGDGLSGVTAIVKDGPGSLTLTGNQNYNGGTTLTAGTITAGDGATSGEIGLGPVSLASGTTLTISRSDFLDYKASVKMRDVSGEGDIILNGGGTLWNYPGGGVAFVSPNTWSGFSGDLRVINGSEFQTIRNGSNAMGTGTVILGDLSTSGSLSQIEGNWTWTNPISVVGPDNKIINRSANAPRTLKLQGTISGDGGLTLEDAASSMTDTNRGFIITNDVALSTSINIPFGVPVRIGGVPGEVSVDGPGQFADSFGSLGTTAVANEGTLTFSRTDAHQVDSAITGEGEVRIGIPSAAALGDTSTQVVTFGSTQSYIGTTTIESGTLFLPTAVTLNSLFVDVAPEGILAGTGTIAGDLDLSGTISPGASVGTLNTDGLFTFLDGANYVCEISAWGTPTSDVFTADELGFFSNSGGVTITIAADAIVDFTESDQTFVIASANSITGFDADFFVVDDSAFSASTGSFGTWTVQQNGSNLELVYAKGSVTDYGTWAFSFDLNPNSDGAPGEDPDKDGVTNEDEYAFGLSPISGSSVSPITAQLDQTTGTFSYTRRNTGLTALTYTYESSSSLEAWDPMTPASVSTDSGDPVETVTITVPAALLGETTLFVRVLAN